MTDHIQEFIKELREELKKPKPPVDSHMQHLLAHHRLPPSAYISRLAHINRRQGSEETWLTMAALAYEMWENETYPKESTP